MNRKITRFEIFVIFLIVFSLFLKTWHNDFITGQDALTYHLPVTRYIAENLKIPENVPYDLYYKGMSKPPLLYIITAPFFIIFGSNEAVAEIMPFIFLTAWLLFLWFWIKKERGKFEIFLFVLLLAYFTVDLMTWFYQGCVVIFFSTVAFYFWKKYIDKNRDWKYLSFFVIFASLSALSKITGAGIFAISFFYLIFHMIKKKDFKPFLTSLPLSFSVFYWYFLRNVKPPALSPAIEQITENMIGHGFVWIFHLEMIFAISLYLVFRKEIEKSEHEIFLFYLPLLIYMIYVSFDPRYPAFLSGFAIFFTAKYLSKINYSKPVKYTILFGSLFIFLLNGFTGFANPQLKELVQINSNKKLCLYLRNDLGIKKANVVGDADFGIGWWCRYNFTTFRDWFETKPFEKPDFVIDSWWNFSASKYQNYNEYKDLEKIKKLYSLNLIWNDGINRVWEVK